MISHRSAPTGPDTITDVQAGAAPIGGPAARNGIYQKGVVDSPGIVNDVALRGRANIINNRPAAGVAIAEARAAERTCPTRLALGPVLIAHRISTGECQKRQREFYHKCWTCAFGNRAATLAAPADR